MPSCTQDKAHLWPAIKWGCHLFYYNSERHSTSPSSGAKQSKAASASAIRLRFIIILYAFRVLFFSSFWGLGVPPWGAWPGLGATHIRIGKAKIRQLK